MWGIIIIVMLALVLGCVATLFIVDGYQAWQEWTRKRLQERERREAAAALARREAQRQEEAANELRWQNRKRQIEAEAAERARQEQANAPVDTWCLGVARMSATGKAMDPLYYKLPKDFKPEWIDEIMKAYEDAENARKEVVVLPHIGITVRTKTAIRIRIREFPLRPDGKINFLI